MIVSLVGWTTLIASIIVPKFMKDKNRARFIGAGLAAFATGIFVGALIVKNF